MNEAVSRSLATLAKRWKLPLTALAVSDDADAAAILRTREILYGVYQNSLAAEIAWLNTPRPDHGGITGRTLIDQRRWRELWDLAEDFGRP